MCLINRYQPGTKLALHRSHPLKDGQHDLLGSERWNLTFRLARARYPNAA